jgi:hypothetical protein
MRQNVSRVKCVLIGLFVNGSLHYNESIAAFNQGPVVQKPVNAKLGLNLLTTHFTDMCIPHFFSLPNGVRRSTQAWLQNLAPFQV